jgi:hypothetical protein
MVYKETSCATGSGETTLLSPRHQSSGLLDGHYHGSSVLFFTKGPKGHPVKLRGSQDRTVDKRQPRSFLKRSSVPWTRTRSPNANEDACPSSTKWKMSPPAEPRDCGEDLRLFPGSCPAEEFIHPPRATRSPGATARSAAALLACDRDFSDEKGAGEQQEGRSLREQK